MAENRDELKHYMLCLPNFNLKGRIAIARCSGEVDFCGAHYGQQPGLFSTPFFEEYLLYA
jgi:hypothetical protein